MGGETARVKSLLMIPRKINGQNFLSGFLATEDAAESPTGFSAACFIALWEFIGIKQGIGYHGVRRHLGTFPSQLQTYLSCYGCEVLRGKKRQNEIWKLVNMDKCETVRGA